MSKLRVSSFAVSIDGFGAGPDQDFQNPLGVGGVALMEWFFPTRTWRHNTPVFVLTHHPRRPQRMAASTEFRFVTDGIHAALQQARDAAGDRDGERATLGETHVPVVWSFAADARRLDTDDPSYQFIENVQLYFQDTFVDTTWPACPRHPNHPLDHADGFWHCPRDKTPVARLGELR